MNGVLDNIRLTMVQTRYGEFTFLAGDAVIGRSLEKYGEWAAHEIDLLCRLPIPGSTILDIGANIGTHAVAFAHARPDCHVIAFEAQPLVHAVLVLNTTRLAPGRVFPHNLVVGTTEGVARFSVDYGGSPNIGAFSLAGGVEKSDRVSSWLVAAAPLDNLQFPSPVGLIKADVEGMELPILQGAVGLLRRDLPYLFLEQNDTSQMPAILALLTSLRYRCFWLETHAFNQANFRGDADNLWYETEMAILAVPPHHSLPDLPPVTGDETVLPRRLDARAGIRVGPVPEPVPPAEEGTSSETTQE